MIPLGFFSYGEVTSDMDLIATAYGTGSSGTITFSSIPQTYKHLQIRGVARSSGSATVLNLTFNGSATSYHWQRVLSPGSTGITSATSGTSAASLIEVWAGTVGAAATNTASAFVIDVLDYSSTVKAKAARGMGGFYAATPYAMTVSGLWTATTAINSLSLVVGSGQSFSTLSRISLYGIKG